MGVLFDLSTCDRRDIVFTRGALSLREAACASPAQKEARGVLTRPATSRGVRYVARQLLGAAKLLWIL